MKGSVVWLLALSILAAAVAGEENDHKYRARKFSRRIHEKRVSEGDPLAMDATETEVSKKPASVAFKKHSRRRISGRRMSDEPVETEFVEPALKKTKPTYSDIKRHRANAGRKMSLNIAAPSAGSGQLADRPHPSGRRTSSPGAQEEIIRSETVHHRFEPSKRRRTLHAVESVEIPEPVLGLSVEQESESVADIGGDSKDTKPYSSEKSGETMEEVVFSSEGSADQRTFFPTRQHPTLKEETSPTAPRLEVEEIKEASTEKEEQEIMTMKNDAEMVKEEKEAMPVEEKEVKNKETDMMEEVTEVQKSEFDLRHKTRVIPDASAIGARVTPKRFFNRIRPNGPSIATVKADLEKQEQISELNNKVATGATPQRKREHINSRISTGVVNAAPRTRQQISNKIPTATVQAAPRSRQQISSRTPTAAGDNFIPVKAPTRTREQISNRVIETVQAAPQPREKISSRTPTAAGDNFTPVKAPTRTREQISNRVIEKVQAAPRSRQQISNRTPTAAGDNFTPVKAPTRTREQISNRVIETVKAPSRTREQIATRLATATATVAPVPRRRMRRPPSPVFKNKVTNVKSIRPPINRRIKVKMVDKVRESMPKGEETESTENSEAETTQSEPSRRIYPRRGGSTTRRFNNNIRRAGAIRGRKPAAAVRRKEPVREEQEEEPTAQENTFTDSVDSTDPPRFLTRTGPKPQLVDDAEVILPPLVTTTTEDKIVEVSKMRGHVQKMRGKTSAAEEEHSVAPEAAELIQQHQLSRRVGDLVGTESQIQYAELPVPRGVFPQTNRIVLIQQRH